MENEIKQKPFWQHYCSTCIYVGSYEYHAGKDEIRRYDIYLCEQSVGLTIIARYGNEGHEYTSGMEFAIEGLKSPIQSEAYKRKPLLYGLILAHRKGLVNINITLKK